MSAEHNHDILIQVETGYISEQSAPDKAQYVFSYTITITNEGKLAAKLLNRHWIITDANRKIQEVHGKGVVGEQPHLNPGESFRYTSGAMLNTPIGSMQGRYEMIDGNGEHFEAPIAAFSLAIPRTLH